MNKFKNLELSTLMVIHSDFTDHCKRMLPTDSKTQEFKEIKSFIVSVQHEIQRRQKQKGNGQ